MAIMTEQYRETLVRTYSDQGVKIRKVGTEEIYNEAVDVVGTLFTYEETDLPVDTIEI